MPPALKKFTPRAIAAGAALLGVALAAACSSQDSFTEADLLQGLDDRGMQFAFVEADSGPGGTFGGMNGFLTSKRFDWGEEMLWVYQFIGHGEALVGASRISPVSLGISYPVEGYRAWRSISGYGFPFPANYFQYGALIVFHHGKDSSTPDALEEMMGESFAGSRASVKRQDGGDDFLLFRNLWREYPVRVDSARVEKLAFSNRDLYRVSFEALTLHSYACSGLTSDTDQEVTGDEIHFTFVQKVLNLGVAGMAEPCDIDWQWEDASFVAEGLTKGRAYNVFINGEQVATFTAG